MDSLEKIGRRIDAELSRLRRFLEDEAAPKTERRAAELLREISRSLSEAASKLESHVASRGPRP